MMLSTLSLVVLGLYTGVGEDGSTQKADGHKPNGGSQRSHSRKWGKCRRCKVRNVNVVFLPCGHVVCCAECGVVSRTCDVCHARIRGSLRTSPLHGD